MMNDIIDKALITGVERLSGWANLLDEINVYPVADGDTGRNLIISLSPLLQPYENHEKRMQSLLLAARGNSGNIAAKFFSGFISAGSSDIILEAAKIGRDYAWEAVKEPKSGTMLTLFDALANILEKVKIIDHQNLSTIINHLEETVHSTVNMLPRLKKANVVDAGALGMFIFFEGFFKTFTGKNSEYNSIVDIFKDKLSVSPLFQEDQETGYCVDFIMNANDDSSEKIKKAIEDDQNAIIVKDGDFVKIHFHTEDKLKMKNSFKSGDLVKWTDDDLGSQISDFKNLDLKQSIHIMTDAAGSVSHKDVKNLGITLLNSYIISGEKCVPETHFDPDELYESMSKGIRVSTSQASDFERHQHYSSVLSRFSRVIYLCVGSVYTGNYNTAADWKKKNDPENRMTVIDTGTASGKLGLVAIATARYSKTVSSADDVVNFAKNALNYCSEYIFLEKLQYLAAGGRMSKTGAFFGDIFNVKPIVSPLPGGAAKAGIAKNKKEQLKFLFKELENDLNVHSKALIMLEYTDNYSWVKDDLKKEIEKRFPDSEIILQPLSQTTGVHTGPGTWGVAYLNIETTDNLNI